MKLFCYITWLLESSFFFPLDLCVMMALLFMNLGGDVVCCMGAFLLQCCWVSKIQERTYLSLLVGFEAGLVCVCCRLLNSYWNGKWGIPVIFLDGFWIWLEPHRFWETGSQASKQKRKEVCWRNMSIKHKIDRDWASKESKFCKWYTIPVSPQTVPKGLIFCSRAKWVFEEGW